MVVVVEFLAHWSRHECGKGDPIVIEGRAIVDSVHRKIEIEEKMKRKKDIFDDLL